MAGLDHILVTPLQDDPLSMQGLSNALASDIFTAVHITITPQIAGEVIEQLDKIHELGAPAVSLSGSERSEAISDILSKARDHCAYIGIHLIWDLPAPFSATNPINLELEEAPTGAGKAWLYVEPDGDVLPGQGIDKVLGNLLRDTWAEIWSKAID
jgi:MoaA/NifB/PqqE/SkfB family radical SAM enzyme